MSDKNRVVVRERGLILRKLGRWITEYGDSGNKMGWVAMKDMAQFVQTKEIKGVYD